MTDLATNVLSYGDNLDILRRYLPDAAVDLVYLDPPFNSNRDDNVIFRDESGNATDAQLLAFEDPGMTDPASSAIVLLPGEGRTIDLGTFEMSGARETRPHPSVATASSRIMPGVAAPSARSSRAMRRTPSFKLKPPLCQHRELGRPTAG